MARLIISRRRQHINIYNGHRHGIDEKKKKTEKTEKKSRAPY